MDVSHIAGPGEVRVLAGRRSFEAHGNRRTRVVSVHGNGGHGPGNSGLVARLNVNGILGWPQPPTTGQW